MNELNKNRICLLTSSQRRRLVLKLALDQHEFQFQSSPAEFLDILESQIQAVTRGGITDSAISLAIDSLFPNPSETANSAQTVEKSTLPTDIASVGKHRIIHLSDLHFTGSEDVDVRVGHLIRDIDLNKTKDQLSLNLVISGDFTDRGSKAGFDLARQFVEKLLHELHLDKCQLHMIPGNHDVVDRNEAYTRVASPSPQKQSQPNYHQEGKIWLERVESVYSERFKEFSELFYEPITGKPYPLKPTDQWELRDGGGNIKFALLNSAWEIDEFHRKRSGVNENAVNALSDEIVRAKANDVLIIAVCHHAIVGPEQILRTGFVDVLQLVGLKVLLHGDVHESLLREYVGRRPWNPVKVIGSGSFYARKDDRPDSTPRLYNIIDINAELSGLRLNTRQQTEPDAPWGPHCCWPNSASDLNTQNAWIDVNI